MWPAPKHNSCFLFSTHQSEFNLTIMCDICECGHNRLLRTIYHQFNDICHQLNSLPLFWHFYSNGSHATSCVCAVPASFKNAWNVLKCDVTVHRGFREPLKLCLPLRNTRTGTSWTWKSGLFRELGSLCVSQLLLCSSSSAPLVRQCYHGGLSCFRQTKVGACWYWWLISQRPSALLEINELPVTC